MPTDLRLSSLLLFHSFMPSSASCGFLSVRDSPDNEEERLLRELSQLLDVYDAHIPRKEELLDQGAQANIELATMSERFMGMKAAMLTTCPEVDIFGRKLGFRALSFDQLMDLPDAFSTATRLMQYLGFSGGEVLEKSDYDLVFVRISPSGNARDQLDWLNALVGGILQVAEPGSGTPVTGDELWICFQRIRVPENRYSFLPLPRKDTNSTLSQLFSRQTYSMKGGKLVNNIMHHHPMLVAQWQRYG